MSLEIENFIEGQYREYIDERPDFRHDHRIADLYESVANPRLRELFAAMHSELLGLFKAMNSRLPTAEEGAHFWADPSRELIAVIDTIRDLQANLRNTDYSFDIDDYYEAIIADCSTWLSPSGGSTIPPHHEKVTLYYIKPIFLCSGDAASYPELQRLGEQMELLGQGGFGLVYRYRHPLIDLDFAVKIYEPVFCSDEEKVAGESRFFRESVMLFQLNHQNIVRVYDVGRMQGRPFIKMEYVSGMTLQKLVDDRGFLSFGNAAKAVGQILAGLQHAHELGILHRDLKPSNVLVQTGGKKWVCKIIDFGVSAFLDENGHTKLTRTGEHVAGGAFIDPLLAKNPRLRDVRSDIYSVGAIMYFLLCGMAPGGGDAEAYLRTTNTILREDQLAVVMRCLSLDIDRRYPSCAELASAIESVS